MDQKMPKRFFDKKTELINAVVEELKATYFYGIDPKIATAINEYCKYSESIANKEYRFSFNKALLDHRYKLEDIYLKERAGDELIDQKIKTYFELGRTIAALPGEYNIKEKMESFLENKEIFKIGNTRKDANIIIDRHLKELKDILNKGEK